MDGKNMEFKVGLFIFIGLLCLCIMIIAFGIEGFQFGVKKYQITAVFKYTNGVIEGAPVRSAGVEVGKVVKIEFQSEKDNYVRIIMDIDDGIVLRKDARAIINSLGIIGEKYVEFVPESIDAPLLTDGDTLIGENPVSLNDLMKEGQLVLLDVRNSITSLLDDENLANIKETIENIRKFSKEDLVDLKNDIEQALERFDDSMKTAKITFEEISNAVIKSGEIIDGVKMGEGTIGKLFSDRELYDQFVAFAKKLNTLIDTLKEKGLLYKPRRSKKSRTKSRK